MFDPDYEESLSNRYAPEGWGADLGTPSHYRPLAGGEYLTAHMVPKLWDEIRAIQDRKNRRVKTWLVK
jgi:hypothetical protein